MSIKNHIFHSQYLWMLTCFYLGFRFFLDLLTKIDPFSGQLLFHFGLSWLVILEIILLFLFASQTKIGYILVEVFFVILIMMNSNQFYFLKNFLLMFQLNGVAVTFAVKLSTKLAMFRVILFAIIHGLFFVLLLVNKYCRETVKQSMWITPNFLRKK